MAGARADCRTSDSDTEEVLEWKKTIRDQVEEDLQRQVRLRLKIDPLVGYNRRHPSTTRSYLLQLQRQKMTVKVETNNLITKDTQPYYTPIVQFNDKVSKQNSRFEEGRNNITLSNTPLTLDRETADESIPSHCNTFTKILDDDEIILPEVFHYVNIKYGPPRAQLNELLERGSYETINVDTSGIGSGPVIKCPVESQVLLPTPDHTNCKTSCERSNYKKEENAVAKNDMGLCNDDAVMAKKSSLQSRLVYEGGQVAYLNGLEFESRFESGNLLKAFQITPREYVLWLAPDLYSKHHTQWFYFMVKRMVAMESYTFHIVNFYKPDSLYNHGMQPLLYSMKTAQRDENGWTRVGHNISYHTSEVQYIPYDIIGNPLYTLTWTMEFPHAEDTCYFAHCFPYPYSQLLSYLSRVQGNSAQSCFVSREILCYTIAGNCCPVLTITNFDEPEEKLRMGVVITARVHPGETNSSWMMQGLIDFLVSDCEHAKNLRNHYVFKLVPMLNPDGVIVGNYRTSLSGVDLNRVYKSPQVDLFPTIYHTKKLIDKFMKERKLLLYVDLHGHSRKQNVFMYGCHIPHCNHLQLLHERVIPYLLSQQAPQMFDYKSCKFGVQKCKEATGRVVTWRMGVANSFTMESTFCGSTLTDKKRHFSIEDLIIIGSSLGEVVHCYRQYIANERYRKRVQSKIAETMMESKKTAIKTDHILPPLVKQPELMQLSSKKSHATKVLNNFMKIDVALLEQESSTSGSDSEDDIFAWSAGKKATSRRRKYFQKANHLDLSQLVKRSQSIKRVGGRFHTNLPQILTSNSSVPSRLPKEREEKSALPPNWKFVNKYQNRHNAGIPIFSEERLQERKEKQKQSNMWQQSCTLPEHTVKSQVNNELGIKRKEGIGYFKLSPQLAKYIHEIWKS